MDLRSGNKFPTIVVVFDPCARSCCAASTQNPKCPKHKFNTKTRQAHTVPHVCCCHTGCVRSPPAQQAGSNTNPNLTSMRCPSCHATLDSIVVQNRQFHSQRAFRIFLLERWSPRFCAAGRPLEAWRPRGGSHCLWRKLQADARLSRSATTR